MEAPANTAAGVTAWAEQVLGGTALAQEWLHRPALALNGQRPVDLLASAEGVQAVHDLLGRIEYGVYT